MCCAVSVAIENVCTYNMDVYSLKKAYEDLYTWATAYAQVHPPPPPPLADHDAYLQHDSNAGFFPPCARHLLHCWTPQMPAGRPPSASMPIHAGMICMQAQADAQCHTKQYGGGVAYGCGWSNAQSYATTEAYSEAHALTVKKILGKYCSCLNKDVLVFASSDLALELLATAHSQANAHVCASGAPPPPSLPLPLLSLYSLPEPSYQLRCLSCLAGPL